MFIVELGADNKLPFLDTLVMINNNSFSTDLYQKKASIGIFFDFGSLTLHSWTVNLVQFLVSACI